ncbi:MAG: hypothetical protein J2P21_05635 [Chloracidobacterium sp.]|nr:hypothetical protein [Chloracidobacterium sp.]
MPRANPVNENYYRGAQPQRGGLKKLSEHWIKTVINLRGASEDTRRSMPGLKPPACVISAFVIIAAYRISNERWTDEQAIAEAKRFGLSGAQFRLLQKASRRSEMSRR